MVGEIRTHMNVANFDCATTDVRSYDFSWSFIFSLSSVQMKESSNRMNEWMNERMEKEKENQKTKRIFIFHDQRNRVEPISFCVLRQVLCLWFLATAAADSQ